MWGKVAKGTLAMLGAAGLALITYVVEHGELPDWVSQCFIWTWKLLTLTAPFVLWELILLVLVIGSLAIFFIHSEGVKVIKRDEEIERLMSKLEEAVGRCQELEASSAELEHNLKEPALPNLNEEQITVLSLIADFENKSLAATLDNLQAHSKLNRLNIQGAIDGLVKYKFICKISTYIGFKCALTAVGRQFILTYG